MDDKKRDVTLKGKPKLSFNIIEVKQTSNTIVAKKEEETSKEENDHHE